MPNAPIYFLMPELGPSFLWRGVELSPGKFKLEEVVCRWDAWTDDAPMSRSVWEGMADWASNYADNFVSETGSLQDWQADWDWDAFHEDGRALAKAFKDEVGETARVVYAPSPEDPEPDFAWEMKAGGEEELWILPFQIEESPSDLDP